MYLVRVYYDIAKRAERAIAHYSAIVETSTNATEILNSATVALGAYGAARVAFDEAEWPSWGDGWAYNREMQNEEERLDALFNVVDRLTDAAIEKTGCQVNFWENFWG